MLTPFISKPDFSSNLNIFTISLISWFEIINVVINDAKPEGWPDPNIVFWIAASAANAAGVNPNGIKTLLANGLSAFLIKSNSVFSNGPRSLPKNPPDCPILDNWVFDSFIFANELFAKALQS